MVCFCCCFCIDCTGSSCPGEVIILCHDCRITSGLSLASLVFSQSSQSTYPHHTSLHRRLFEIGLTKTLQLMSSRLGTRSYVCWPLHHLNDLRNFAYCKFKWWMREQLSFQSLIFQSLNLLFSEGRSWINFFIVKQGRVGVGRHPLDTHASTRYWS